VPVKFSKPPDKKPVNKKNQRLLFLPATGYRNNNDGTLYNAGENGNYWSSTQNDSNNAYNLNFNEWNADWNNNNRSFGFSVRAVAELSVNRFFLVETRHAASLHFFTQNKIMERQQLLEDLLAAYYEARKNKRNTINQLRFEFNQEHEITGLCDEILTHTYKIRPSICFVVDKPVKREILAADFRDRVVHHLIFNYINPILDTQFITDSYSCRKGKGTHYGIKRVAGFVRECSKNYSEDCYILKLDISGYFMSINKHKLWGKLQTMLQEAPPDLPSGEEKEERIPNVGVDCTSFPPEGGLRGAFDLVHYLLEKVIWNDPREGCIVKGKPADWDGLPPSKSLFHAAPDCGLPIGNLTSQLFSNVYLHDFDCFVKNELQVKKIF